MKPLKTASAIRTGVRLLAFLVSLSPVQPACADGWNLKFA